MVLAAGLGLRVVTQVAYRPALFYIDSYKYLTGSGGSDPVGYNILLKPILWLGNLAVVAGFQHLLGLAMGVIIYALLIRRGAARWAATLATAPILLDAYQLQMEQTIMPDVTFEAFIVAGLAILLWRPRPGFWRLAAGALVLGLAADVRQIGELLIIPAVVFAVLVARGWRRRLGYLAVAIACFAVPVLGYMTVSSVTGNGFALTTNGGNVLYGRAAVAADCATLKLPADERSLCPSPAVAAWGIDRIINNADGPLGSYQTMAGKTASQAAASGFSFAVLKQQPLAIPLSVLRDATRLFALTRDGAPNITQISRWQFQPGYATYPPGVTLSFVASQAHEYRRRRPSGGEAAGLVPAGLSAGRRVHPRPAARGHDGGRRDRLAVHLLRAQVPAPEKRRGIRRRPATGRGGPAREPGRHRRGARLRRIRVLLALPASRAGHTADRGHVRLSGRLPARPRAPAQLSRRLLDATGLTSCRASPRKPGGSRIRWLAGTHRQNRPRTA